MMSRHKNSGKVLTILLLHLSWTIHTQAFPTPQTQNLTATDIVSATGVNTTPSNSRLSDSELLELLYATYIVNIENATTRASEVRHTSLQPALLDYENLTDVANLEKDVTNSTDNETDLVLPPDVYEVPLSLWINGESANPDVPDKIEDTADGAEQVILDALRRSVESSDDHSIRHRGRRLADRNNRRVSEDSSALLPIDSVDPNILSLFQPQQDSEESTGSLDILRQRDKFNITVDYDATFHNIDSTKLIEIIAIMRTDCSEIPKRKKIVRWVLETRGILFECRNGAWVVTYLSRPQGKPRPRSVTDCHEIHSEGLELENPERPHQLVIHYNDGERKSKEVLCKHDDRHTDHQLIDNYINTNPDLQHLPNSQSIAGAWTVIQRRATGNVKFYRSMKRYKRGFGSVENGEYWLGLEMLHEVTHARDYMLRVELTGADNITYFSEYERIRVSSEAKNYRLRLGSFITPANATLSAGDFLTLHHGGKFHTRDSDKFSVNCARLYGTAFWFRGCWAAVNLNGPYITSDESNSGVRWATTNPNEVRRVWKTEMMIKPVL